MLRNIKVAFFNKIYINIIVLYFYINKKYNEIK